MKVEQLWDGLKLLNLLDQAQELSTSAIKAKIGTLTTELKAIRIPTKNQVSFMWA